MSDLTPEFTNEERRVAAYQGGSTPTDPATVTPDTPLEALNLNWSERYLPERTRTKHVHRLHPYLGKYIPQLVEVFLRKYFSPGHTIYDPFVGSGTTLVQANELGIHAIGCDISAFNALLCRVKTGRYDLALLRAEVMDALAAVEKDTAGDLGHLPLFSRMEASDGPPDTTNDYLRTWFAPKARRELLAYRARIDQAGYQYAEVLKVILSRSARSARLTTHFDLDFPKKPQTEPYYCYKHGRICEPTEDALKFLKRYSLDAIARIGEFAALRTDARVTVVHGDSREIDLPPIDGVITSPPYVGLIDYHQQHHYAFELLGLGDNRHREIGPATGGTSKRAQTAYQEGIADVFRRALGAMQPGGRLIVIAGDKHELYGQIARGLDVVVEQIIQRHVNRRTGRRSGEFYESIFVWQKL
jgi:DNA modification methylase